MSPRPLLAALALVALAAAGAGAAGIVNLHGLQQDTPPPVSSGSDSLASPDSIVAAFKKFNAALDDVVTNLNAQFAPLAVDFVRQYSSAPGRTELRKVFKARGTIKERREAEKQAKLGHGENGVLTNEGVDVRDAMSKDKKFGLLYAQKAVELTKDDEVRAAMSEAVRRLNNGGEIPVDEGAASPPTASPVGSQEAPRFAEVAEGVDGGAADAYHVIVRAFIPGPGSAAAKGFKSASGFLGMGSAKLAAPSAFSHHYGLPATTHGTHPGYGGYVVGIYETDEVFDSSHRDFTLTENDNKHSKTHVHVKLSKKAGGSWRRAGVAAACSRTHHYADSSLPPIWYKGLVCNKKASPPKAPVSSFRGTRTTASFTVKVRVGNPCVPGSYYAGPIMHTVHVKADFAARTFSVSGSKSVFPAFEILFGRDPKNLNAMQWDVAGENFYGLMKSQRKISHKVSYV